MSVYTECFCCSDDYEARDVLIGNASEEGGFLYPKNHPWFAETSGARFTWFKTERQACAFQRHWRELFGLNQMTGEPLSE